MKLPPVPKWNAATDDIDSADVFARAQEYEKSFLPSDINYPRTGQVWEAVQDCEVGFVASFQACSPFEFRIIPGQRPPGSLPAIPVGKARLSRGERVCVVHADDSKPLVIWFQPLRYEELHESIVPAPVRSIPGYSYYRLTLRTVRTRCFLDTEACYFMQTFRAVEETG